MLNLDEAEAQRGTRISRWQGGLEAHLWALCPMFSPCFAPSGPIRQHLLAFFYGRRNNGAGTAFEATIGEAWLSLG